MLLIFATSSRWQRNPMNDYHDKDANGSEDEGKVVPLRPPESPEQRDPRLEELIRELRQAVPIDNKFSDAEVIEDEEKFRKRFGIGFRWNRRDREGLIALKVLYDLTDDEIRHFHYTRNLQRTPFGVRLIANRWLALYGWFQLTVFAPLALALLIVTVPNAILTPSKAIEPTLWLMALVLLCFTIYWLYIQPWRVQCRVERDRRSQAASIAS